jgi:folate-binding protein YgfZ
MDGSTLAIELPVEDLISATKGCYLGQEVVARGTARGQVQRRLVGVRFDGGRARSRRVAPARGEGRRARDLGRPRAGADEPIGLALVRREHWAPGSELEIDARPRARGAVPARLTRRRSWTRRLPRFEHPAIKHIRS